MTATGRLLRALGALVALALGAPAARAGDAPPAPLAVAEAAAPAEGRPAAAAPLRIGPAHERTLRRLVLRGGSPAPWTVEAVATADGEARVRLRDPRVGGSEAGADAEVVVVLRPRARPGPGEETAHFRVEVDGPRGADPAAREAARAELVARVRANDAVDVWASAPAAAPRHEPGPPPPTPAAGPALPRPADWSRVRPATWATLALLALALAGVVAAGRRRGGAPLLGGPPEPPPVGRRPREWLVPAALTAAAAAAWLGPTWIRYEGLGLYGQDIGIYAHSYWHASQGNGLFNSPEAMDHLGSHASPVLWLVVPFYLLWPSFWTVIVVHHLALASSALPLWLLARRRLAPLPAALAVAVCLANPLLPAIAYGVHAVTFAIPALLWAFWAAEARRPVALAAAVVLALSCKENVGLVVLFMGLWLGLDRATRRAGLALVLAGALGVVGGLGAIVPAHFGDHHGNTMVRFAPLGGSWREILLSPLLRPGAFWPTLLSADTARYAALLLVPFALLPLLAPRALLLVVPCFMQNVLSSTPMMRTGSYHFDSLALPGLCLAFFVALGRLSAGAARGGAPAAPWRARAVAGGLAALLALLVALHDHAPRPLTAELHHWRADAARDVVARVPPGLPTLSPHNLQPFLADRVVSESYPEPLAWDTIPPWFEVVVVARDPEGDDPTPPGLREAYRNAHYRILRRAPSTAP